MALIEHLRSVERQTGVTPQALLDAPPCPPGCEELWRTFCDLSDCRSWGEAPQRITFADVDAFQRVSGSRLQPWELEAIRRADAAWLEQWAERLPRND